MPQWVNDRIKEIENLDKDFRVKFPFNPQRKRNYFYPEHIGRVGRKRAKKHLDWFVGISGFEGSGKTTLAIECCAYTRKEFDIEKNIIYAPTNEEIQNKIVNMPKGSAFSVDEAIRVMYKYDWASKTNKFLDKLARMARKEEKVVFLCMPKFMEFSKAWLEHRINFWIHIVSRGVAVMFKPDDANIFSGTDRWHLKDCDERFRKDSVRFGKNLNLSSKLAIYKAMPNFVGVLLFNDLNQETRNKYLEISERERYKDMEKDEEKKEETLPVEEEPPVIEDIYDKKSTWTY